MKVKSVKVGEKIDFCDCGKGEVRLVRLSRDKQAYIVTCKCGAIYYVTVAGRKE